MSRFLWFSVYKYNIIVPSAFLFIYRCLFLFCFVFLFVFFSVSDHVCHVDVEESEVPASNSSARTVYT